ncbi:MAG TPA: IclR family transcriptional regulator C-terminal domain-containing protein [Paracoccaceae bacterium]|nr:IclR family transcriptional regulator C-terminal domain-containing protein [Paracoccaceae bacterium]
MKSVQDVEEVRAGQVRSISRALAILRALAASSDGLTLSETAERAGLAPSTAHRILTTLESERFVRFEAAGGLWQVGVAAFTIGSAFARNRDIVGLSRPYLRRLMEVTGETANIYVESGGEAICMAQVESRFPMRAITQVGGRAKMHWSAAGKALLSAMPDEQVLRLLSEQGMPRAAPNTITTPEALLRELAQIRRRRFAHDGEEFAEGLRCIALPLLDEVGRAVAAISISGPTARMMPGRIPSLEEVLGQVADEIMREYGGRAPGGQIPAGRGVGALL